jgi:hypothetical protein
VAQRNPIGASAEVIEHHARLHPCGPQEAISVVCPCGTTHAICCMKCREPVFGAVMPGTWCRHAVDLIGPESEAAA